MFFHQIKRFQYFFLILIADSRLVLYYQYLLLLGVKVSIFQLRSILYANPTYPSLLSIIDTFKTFNCKAVAVKIELKNHENLSPPFLCQSYNGELILVLQIDNGSLTILNEKIKKEILTFENFYNIWNGIIIYAENLNISIIERKVSFKNWVANLKILAFSFATILFFQLSVLLPLTLFPLLLLKFLGFIVCYAIISFENSNSTLNKFCKSIQNGNCDAVLNSNASKLFGVLPLSYVGLFFYTFTALLIFDKCEFNLIVSNILSFLGLLFIPFSLYYQKFKIKQWCILCLIILLEIFLECIAILFLETISLTQIIPSIDYTKKIFNVFIISFLVVYFFIRFNQRDKQSNDVKKKYNTLKYKDTVFNSLISHGKRHELDNIVNIGIFYGNRNCTNNLLMVCSPFCEPCSNSHKELKLLLLNNLDLNVQVIFFVDLDINSPYNIATSAILNCADKGASTFLEEWFNSDFQTKLSIVENYKNNLYENKVQDRIKLMNEWCLKNEVQQTPTFYLNGYELPNEYDINDLRYFIEDEAVI